MNCDTTELEAIQNKIIRIPGFPPTMLDRDLAKLYETETRKINQAVKRNQDRFPSDFCFQLTDEEAEKLVSQSVIPKQIITKSTPYAFTREGANMLSAVLHTPIAVQRSVQIMRAFSAIEEQTQSRIDPIQVLNDPEAMRGLLLTYSEKVISLESTVKEQTPKVYALDRISTADGSMCITDAAKTLQLRPKDLFRWMFSQGWIYRRPGGIHWIGYQHRLQQAVLVHKVTTLSTSDGQDKVTEQVRVTPKGLVMIAEKFSTVAAA